MKTQPEPNPPGVNVPPLLAAFLSGRRDLITNRWIEAVRRNHTMEAAKEVNDAELADHLPKLFDDLSATLQGKPVAREAKSDAEAHWAHRWQQHYETEKVLEDLGIVSRILLSPRVGNSSAKIACSNAWRGSYAGDGFDPGV